jgi:hypothetical protein
MTDDATGHPPALIQQLLQWLVSSLQQLVVIRGADTDTILMFVIQKWQACTSVELVQRALSPPEGDNVYAPLKSTIWHIIHIMQNLQAHTSRCETLQWLMTAIVWHIAGVHMARAYVQNVMIPTLMQTPICGLSHITQMTVHYEAAHDEWYVSTEGSNLLEMCMPRAGTFHKLHLCRSRCLTTNIPEIIACFGLEAVCWMFSNGSLASSLGVSNASCRLLVDHMASRGLWRGVNRTSILSLSGTLNAPGNNDHFCPLLYS